MENCIFKLHVRNVINISSFYGLLDLIYHDGLFCPILLHLDITLVITQKYDQVESYNLVCW